MGADQAELVAELKKLRRGRGLTPTVISDRLVELLGADNAAAAYDMIVTALRAMDDDIYSRAVRSAFAVDMRQPGILEERRISFLAQNDRVDISTAKNWEERGLKELAARLADGGSELRDVALELFIKGGVVIRAVTNHQPPQERLTADPALALPAFIVEIAQPCRLHFKLHFEDEPPRRLWAGHSPIVMDLIDGHRMREVDPTRQPATFIWRTTSPDTFYGVGWRY